jgi:hypothetical protein
MTFQSLLRQHGLRPSALLPCNSQSPQPPPNFKGIADPPCTIFLMFEPERKNNRVAGVDDATVGFLRWVQKK